MITKKYHYELELGNGWHAHLVRPPESAVWYIKYVDWSSLVSPQFLLSSREFAENFDWQRVAFPTPDAAQNFIKAKLQAV
ncbi:MAG: hypothetical protein K8T25_15290 [Planctomycetia bacterium]|nr:hypothetical protein [Planctomycetia bacterium]